MSANSRLPAKERSKTKPPLSECWPYERERGREKRAESTGGSAGHLTSLRPLFLCGSHGAYVQYGSLGAYV